MNGSWVINKHTYSYADMFQNLGSMQLLEEIRATPNDPVFNKSQKKQEIIWHKQQIYHDKQNADFLAYPSAQQVKEAWREGKRQAHTKAMSLGMFPRQQHNQQANYQDPPDDPPDMPPDIPPDIPLEMPPDMPPDDQGYSYSRYGSSGTNDLCECFYNPHAVDVDLNDLLSEKDLSNEDNQDITHEDDNEDTVERFWITILKKTPSQFQ